MRAAPDIPESVEGLANAHIVYRLKARVLRSKFNHDITAKKVCGPHCTRFWLKSDMQCSICVSFAPSPPSPSS